MANNKEHTPRTIEEIESFQHTCEHRGKTTRGTAASKPWECDEWLFVIPLEGSWDVVTFSYYTGLGHRKERNQWEGPRPVRPKLAGLIASLIWDSEACSLSFPDWCANLGYDTDSRKALETYLLCQENGEKLHKLFSRDKIEHLNKLLENY